MAYIQFKDGEGSLMNRKSTGTGASNDAFITVVSLEGATPDTTGGDLVAINAATAGTHTGVDIIAGAVSATHMQCDVLALPALVDTAAGDLDAINTATAATKTAVETIAGAVAATHMQCDVLTLPSVKGSITTVHNGIAETATSTEVDCTGYNALIVHAVVTGAQAWTIAVQGAMTTGGVFAAAYDGTTAMSVGTMSTSMCVTWKGTPDFIKIVATRDGSASTIVVKVQPVNIAR